MSIYINKMPIRSMAWMNAIACRAHTRSDSCINGAARTGVGKTWEQRVYTNGRVATLGLGSYFRSELTAARALAVLDAMTGSPKLCPAFIFSGTSLP